MPITKLNINTFRNLESVSTELSNVNIIQGENGSGKTSFLEAIHFLGLGKSFRTHIINRIVSHNADSFALFANVLGVDQENKAIGIERSCNGRSRMRIAGEDVHSASKLAEVLPLQLLEPHSFSLLEGGPSLRRSFVDWGVFHVEHNFLNIWKNYSRCVKQRNTALRTQCKRDEILSWNAEVIENGIKIDAARKSYIELFCETLYEILTVLIELPELSIHYYSGWPADKSYEEALTDAFMRDFSLGYTQFGPHHADLKIKVGKHPAKEVLSRGQQKLFICAMKIAQGLLFKQVKQQSCIYLLDDLVAELDNHNQEKILQLLSEQESQLFITCTDANTILTHLNTVSRKVMHIEAGNIQ